MKLQKFQSAVFQCGQLVDTALMTAALELGVQEDDIEAAITDSIRVSQASYDGKVKLLEMKGE